MLNFQYWTFRVGLLVRKNVLIGDRSIDISDNLQGVYIVEFRTKESVIRKQLWLESK